MSARLRITLMTAAAPVTTQLNCVRRTRPIPITTTTEPANATTAKESGATTVDDSANAGVAIHSTSQGERSPRPVATHVVMTVTYVSTYAYVRFASPSS